MDAWPCEDDAPPLLSAAQKGDITELLLPPLHVYPHRLGDQLCDVPHARLYSVAVAHPGDVHGAAGVVADRGGGARRRDAVDLVLHDRAGNRRVFDGEGAAEAAALVGLLHRPELDVAELLQEPHA